MQIYTKILIGMAIGVIIGVFAGPKSTFLDADLYRTTVSSSDTNLAMPLGNHLKARWTTVGTGACPKDLNADALKTCRLPLPFPAGLRIDTTGMDIVTIANERHVSGRVRVDERMWLKGSEALKNRLKALDVSPGSHIAVLFKLSRLMVNGEAMYQPSPISGLGDTITSSIKPVGSLFLKLIKMVIVPLVFASLLVGIASLGDLNKLGRIGGKTLGVYMVTTAIAVSIGLLSAQIIRPGDAIGDADKAALEAQFKSAATDRASKAGEAPGFVENMLNIVPENPIGSLASGDMLQVIFFAMIFGVTLTMVGGKKAEVVVTFFDCVQEAMVMTIHLVMKLAPYGVAALVADVIGNSGWSVLIALMVYALTVLIGLFLQTILVYGGLVRFVAKVPLIQFLKAIRPAQLIAFSTSSSSATLPVSMECAEERLGISNPVSSFVLPLGSTVNMDGTALYQGVAAVFIAQVFVPGGLSFADQLTIVLTATLASVGAAGVPGAGMVTLAMVLTAVGIPEVGIALILGMDRLLDMFRTAVNVTGDLSVTAVMAVSEGETLQILSPEDDAKDPNRGFEGRTEVAQRPVESDD